MKILHAGPLRCGYENGFLRRVMYGDHEVLRMIYFALRDHNWNTMTCRIENELLSEKDEEFEITYEGLHVDGGVQLMEWKGLIRGDRNGVITFQIEGTATLDFMKNRAGFCVLHPLGDGGKDCTVVHPDGTRSVLPFPVEVAAENPFKNIQSMSWASAGVPFDLTFEGDVFETEDQRNWADASYKTFCTPLDRPFPVELRKGQRVFQRVTLQPAAQLQRPAGRRQHVSLKERDGEILFPRLGVGASTEQATVSAAAAALLRTLKFHHYRIDVIPGRENWVSAFSSGYETAFSLGLPLEVALHLGDDFRESMEAFAVICQQNRIQLRKVLLLSDRGMVTDQKVIDSLGTLKATFPKVKFGAGTNYNFNEINKNHRQAGRVDFISFGIDPQEHASDDLTILENIASGGHLVRSAKAIYGADVPVHISPLTLKKRFNPYATNPEDVYIPEALKADPRLKQDLGAVWALGSLCSLAAGGAEAVTVLQTVGNQGIMTPAGDPYPVYEVLKMLAPYQGKTARILESSDPLSVLGIVLDGATLVVANYTKEGQTVRWESDEWQLQELEIKVIPLHGA